VKKREQNECTIYENDEGDITISVRHDTKGYFEDLYGKGQLDKLVEADFDRWKRMKTEAKEDERRLRSKD
jgi:hypothetical protein